MQTNSITGRQKMDGENDKLKIVDFKPKAKDEPAINSGLVSFLEKQLELAKTGELKGFACAYISDEMYGYRRDWVGLKYRELSGLVGQTSALNMALIQDLIDSSLPVDE